MDLMAVHLAASMGVGQRRTLQTIDRQLQQLPLRQSLLLLSEICGKVDRLSLDPAEQIEFAYRVLPPQAARRAEPLLLRDHPPTGVLSAQVIVLLGIRLLAVSSDNAPPVDDVPALARRLGALCLSLADHVSNITPDSEATILEVVRLGGFYASGEHPGWLSLAGRLYFDVLPTLGQHPDWMAPLERFREGAAIDLERFWAITAMQGSAAEHSDEHFQFPVNLREHPIPDDELEAWCHLLAQSIEDAASLARRDIELPVGWSMSSVWKRPIVDFGEGRGPTLRPRLLSMQAEPAQLFWHVRDVLIEQGVAHTDWSGLYGAAVERLGVELAREHLSSDVVLNEDEFTERWAIPSGPQRADLAVVTQDGDLIVADFVSRQFTRDTTSTGDFAALAKDLKLAVAEKLPQVDKTLEYAVAGEPEALRLYPIVVTGGPLPYIPMLDQVVEDELTGQEMSVVGNGPRCAAWVAMDLLNFNLLLRACALLDVGIGRMIDEWQDSGLGRNTFRAWFLLSGRGKGVGGGGLPDDWMERINRYLTQWP